MNDTFDFSRFWKYFKYDVTCGIRENRIKILSFLILPVIMYFFAVLFNYAVSGNPYLDFPDTFRTSIFKIFFILFVAVEYPLYCYGFVTDKRLSPEWMLIPVSSFEKSLSMILNAVILAPICYFLSYMVLDLLLSLFPHAGSPILVKIPGIINDFVVYNDGGPSTLKIGKFSIVLLSIFLMFDSILAFLFGAIFFKKNKTANTLLWVAVMLMAAIAIIVGIGYLFAKGGSFDGIEPTLQTLSVILNITITILIIVPFFALLAGIFFRVKTLKQ